MDKKCSLNNYFKSEAYGLSMFEQCALSRAHWKHPYPHNNNNNSWWHSVWVYGVLLHTAWQSHVACVPIQTHTRTHSHTRVRRIVMTFIVSSKGQLGCRSRHITAVCVIWMISFAWHCIVADTSVSRASVTPVAADTLHEAVTIARIRSSERDKQRRKDTDKARQSVKRPLSPIVHVFWFCSWSTALSNSNIGLAVPVAVSGDLISSASHIIKLGKTDFFLLNRSIQALRIDAATTNRRRKYVWFIFESSRFVRGTGRLGDF